MESGAVTKTRTTERVERIQPRRGENVCRVPSAAPFSAAHRPVISMERGANSLDVAVSRCQPSGDEISKRLDRADAVERAIGGPGRICRHAPDRKIAFRAKEYPPISASPANRSRGLAGLLFPLSATSGGSASFLLVVVLDIHRYGVTYYEDKD